MTDSLTIRPYRDSDEHAALALLHATLAGGPTGERTAEFFGWKHRENPFGASPGLVAEDDGRLVGLRLMLRWRFASGNRTIDAVRAVDTATHPDYQGRGIFKCLTLRLLDTLNGDAAFVFNTPNEQSLPGYLRMGWQPAGRVPIAIRPVRVGAVARRGFAAARRRSASNGLAALPSSGLPPAGAVLGDTERLRPLLDAVSAADRREPRWHTERTADFLRWRYANAPGLNYQVAVTEHGGEITGLALGRVRARSGLCEFTLADLLVRPGDRRAARRLLADVRRAGGCDHVATHLATGTDLRAAARRAGYLSLPGVGMTFVTRPVGRAAAAPPAISDYCFTLGDLEVF